MGSVVQLVIYMPIGGSLHPFIVVQAMGTRVRSFQDEDALMREFGVPLMNPPLRRGRPASSGDIPQLTLQGDRMYDYMPTCMEGSGQDTGRFSWRDDYAAPQHVGSGVPASGVPAPESLIFGGMEIGAGQSQPCVPTTTSLGYALLHNSARARFTAINSNLFFCEMLSLAGNVTLTMYALGHCGSRA